MSQGVTIKDLAQELGLHFTTVSCALRGNGTISKATRERVLEAAKRMDYRPNRLAQATRSGKSQTVGLVLGGDTQKSALQLRRIEQHAWDSGYHVLVGHGIGDVRNATSEALLQRELQQVERFAGYRVDGLIIQSALTYGEAAHRRQFWEEVQSVANSGISVVAYDCLCEVDLPQVIIDRRVLGNAAGIHLCELGFSSLMYAGNTQTFHSQRIFAGLQEVEGLQVVACDLDVTDLVSVSEGYRAAEHWLTLPSRPEVIVAANTFIAHGVLHQLLRRGFNVPEDISLLAIGAGEILRWPPKRISAISSSFEELAEQTWKLLSKQWDGPLVDKSVSLGFHVWEGETLMSPELRYK
jgi:LacI family transcriptional regulator